MDDNCESNALHRSYTCKQMQTAKPEECHYGNKELSNVLLLGRLNP